MPPKRSRTALSSDATSSIRLTSTTAVMTSAAPPGAAADNRVAASARRSAPISATQTFMPSSANRIAAASPMPDAPPVITATLLADRTGWVTRLSPWRRCQHIPQWMDAPTTHEPAWVIFVPRFRRRGRHALRYGLGTVDSRTIDPRDNQSTDIRESEHGCHTGNSDHASSVCGWVLQADADRRQMGRCRLGQAVRDPQSRHRRTARDRRRGRRRGHQSCGRRGPPRVRGSLEQGEAVRAAEPAAQARRSRREEFR